MDSILVSSIAPLVNRLSRISRPASCAKEAGHARTQTISHRCYFSDAPVRYDRAALLTGALLIAIAVVSWVALIRRGNMGSMDVQPSMNGAMNGGMDQGTGASMLLSPLGAAAFLAAWSVMMAAMMLPSATPLISLYAAIQRRSPRERGGVPALPLALVDLLL